MSLGTASVGWVDALAELEGALEHGERMVEQGRHEELRVVPVPVVATGLPPELASRATALQHRLTALTHHVVAAMATTSRELEVAARQRADRPERTERREDRSWQPAYIDARA